VGQGGHSCVGGQGCGHGVGHGFTPHSGFGQGFAQGFSLFGPQEFAVVELWPKTAVATRSDATIHGLVFVSKFSIFALHFGRIVKFFSFR
jgi:hypothetical protein